MQTGRPRRVRKRRNRSSEEIWQQTSNPPFHFCARPILSSALLCLQAWSLQPPSAEWRILYIIPIQIRDLCKRNRPCRTGARAAKNAAAQNSPNEASKKNSGRARLYTTNGAHENRL